MSVGMGLGVWGRKEQIRPSGDSRLFSPVSWLKAKTGESKQGCCDKWFVPSVAFVTANYACFSTLAGTVTWVDSGPAFLE